MGHARSLLYLMSWIRELSIVLLVKWPLLICVLLCTKPKFLPRYYFRYHFSNGFPATREPLELFVL